MIFNMNHKNQTEFDFLQKICAYFDTLDIDLNGKTICVCLSGGADSVALLLSLSAISYEYNFKVSACHFNHMIRGDEADKDEEFCKEFCKTNNIKLYCGRDDVPAYAKLYKKSIEEAARECRYAFFERIYGKNDVDFCATAHNMNDDAETLLFNLIRGTGSNGASAISAVNKYILRPLLKIKRSEIEEFLEIYGQSFVTDSTNLSDEYTRNYIRHVVIPDIEKINPSVIDALSRYIDACRIDRNYFESETARHMDDDLRVLHKALRHRIIIKKYRNISNDFLNHNLLYQLDDSLFTKKRAIVPMNDEFEAIIQEGKIDFYRREENVKFEFDDIELSYGMNTLFGNRVIINLSDDIIDECENFNKISISALLSFDNIVGKLRVRNRRVGDKICIHGVNRSLKKLFIEKKIPKEYRDIIPIISDEQGIIYVPFVGIADRVYPIKPILKKYIYTVLDTVDRERWNNAYEK